MKKSLQFLGSELSIIERDKENSTFHILPVPLEKTVSFGSGTSKGPYSILKASNELERFTGNSEPCKFGIHTLPMIDCNKKIEDVLKDIEDKIFEVTKKNKIPICLGGEHTLTYGAVKGVRKYFKNFLNTEIGIVQFDAHTDLRPTYKGNKFSHACVMNLIYNEKIPMVQYGTRAFSKKEDNFRKVNKIPFINANKLNQKSIKIPENFPKKIYLTIDVDFFDPSLIFATGTPVPGGFFYNQTLNFLKKISKGRQIVGFDLVELAPIKKIFSNEFIVASFAYNLMEICKT